jgi:hypothetical protein
MTQPAAAPYSTGAPMEPVELTVSEDLLSKVTDKDLLRTGGLIGGKWTQATSRATFHVSRQLQLRDPGQAWALAADAAAPAVRAMPAIISHKMQESVASPLALLGLFVVALDHLKLCVVCIAIRNALQQRSYTEFISSTHNMCMRLGAGPQLNQQCGSAVVAP